MISERDFASRYPQKLNFFPIFLYTPLTHLTIMLNIRTIKSKYPQFYKATYDLIEFELFVDNSFKTEYGESSLDYIIAISNFNNEITDSSNNNNKSIFAQTYQLKFDIFVKESYPLSLLFGKDETFNFIDFTKRYCSYKVSECT